MPTTGRASPVTAAVLSFTPPSTWPTCAEMPEDLALYAQVKGHHIPLRRDACLNPPTPALLSLQPVSLGNGLRAPAALRIAAVVPPSASSGRDYYISPRGSDDADGKSPATALRSLSQLGLVKFNPGDRIILEAGATYVGSLQLSPANAAGPITITSLDSSGRIGKPATIESGNGPGIVVANLADVSISGLRIHGAGATKSSAGGILIKNDVIDTQLANIRISNIEVSGFREEGVKVLSAAAGAGFKHVGISDVVSHDNGRAGIVVGTIDSVYPQKPHEDVRIEYSKAYRNQGIPGQPEHTGSGIILAGTRGGGIEHSEAYENGALCDATQTGGPEGIWTYNADSVVIQYNKSHHNHTNNRADGGGFGFDGGTTNSIIQYNVSWENDSYAFQIYDFFWAPFSGNTVRHNVSVDDGRRLPNRFGTKGHDVFAIFGRVLNTEVTHNIAQITGDAQAEPHIIGLNKWIGENLHITENIFVVRGGVRPFDVQESTGKNLQLDKNVYRFDSPPRPFAWNGKNYDSIAAWQADLGLAPHEDIAMNNPQIAETLERLKKKPYLTAADFFSAYDEVRRLTGSDPGTPKERDASGPHWFTTQRRARKTELTPSRHVRDRR